MYPPLREAGKEKEGWKEARAICRCPLHAHCTPAGPGISARHLVRGILRTRGTAPSNSREAKEGDEAKDSASISNSRLYQISGGLKRNSKGPEHETIRRDGE